MSGTIVDRIDATRRVAAIDEERCIGCTLCIQACPFDAILGAAKHMHTVLVELCTGCELCVPPCPVDCIAMVAPGPGDVWDRARADAARARHERRDARLARDSREARDPAGTARKRAVVRAAIERARAKKAAAARRVR